MLLHNALIIYILLSFISHFLDFYPDPVVNLTILDSSIETLILNNTANDTITVVSLNISWSPGNLNGKLKNYEVIIFSNNVVNGLEALVYQVCNILYFLSLLCS